MVDSKISFYLQNNNNLFNNDVLVVCYKVDENKIGEGGFGEVYKVRKCDTFFLFYHVFDANK